MPVSKRISRRPNRSTHESSTVGNRIGFLRTAVMSVHKSDRERGRGLAIVIVVLVIISLLQGGLSYSVLLGALRKRGNIFNVESPLTGLHWLVRAIVLVLAGALWTLGRKRALFRVIIVANSFFTAILLTDVAFLFSVLSGSPRRHDAARRCRAHRIVEHSNLLDLVLDH